MIKISKIDKINQDLKVYHAYFLIVNIQIFDKNYKGSQRLK